MNVFISASTQWRTGPNGAIGLDYTALESTMRMMGVKRQAMGSVLEEIRTMEDVALITMRETKKL